MWRNTKRTKNKDGLHVSTHLFLLTFRLLRLLFCGGSPRTADVEPLCLRIELQAPPMLIIPELMLFVPGDDTLKKEVLTMSNMKS